MRDDLNRWGRSGGAESASEPPRLPHVEPTAPPPPPPPRPLPPNVTGVPGGYVLLLVGGLFSSIALLFILVGAILIATGNSEGAFFSLVPLIHLTVGVGMIWFALHHRRRRRRLAVEGRVAVAQIERVGFDRSTRVNGRSPLKVEYRFDVAGTSFRGTRSSFNRAATAHLPDDAIWVLYDRDDPSDNMEWPPL